MQTTRGFIGTIVFLLLATFSLKGQETHAGFPGGPVDPPRIEKTYDLYLGFHLQASSRGELSETTRRYAEVGISKTQIIDARPHPPSAVTLYVSGELPVNNVDEIYGAKVGGWIQIWVFSLGLAAVYYTDFDQGNFKVRPELGIGIQRFRLGFGYNIPTIHNDEFAEMSDFNMQAFLNYSIPFVKKMSSSK